MSKIVLISENKNNRVVVYYCFVYTVIRLFVNKQKRWWKKETFERVDT